MPELETKIESLISELPDPEGARLFYRRITSEQTGARRLFERDWGLLADSLALAAWSPLLATTLAQNFEYLSWLSRERTAARVKTAEELGESLARFVLTHTQVEPQIQLARFRRRELLRIYLHDLRRTTTIVETTEELSNLADAILRHALQLAHQELENLYGTPQCTDERGRRMPSSASIVALGKLGSRELNYSSDIDLLFLYSEDGETSGAGERGATTNREFYCKLAGRVSRLVGQQTGEGAAYRVDLRLRPHGRDGAPAVSLAEALNYYRERAHAWELQALIRMRASAGSPTLFARFSEGVRERVYRTDETVAHALFNVRLAKQKIDRFHHKETGGYNVKLGRGGIREIEFIAQALQLAHGGRDAWLHAPHTLISLGRLADRSLITERERTELSEAYSFLRMLEHRVQMEHGLQTHAVPEDAARRLTLARRVHFKSEDALADFNLALAEQTSKVRAAYERVFAGADVEPAQEILQTTETFADAQGATNNPAGQTQRTDLRIEETARGVLNEKRAQTLLARVRMSIEKSDAPLACSETETDVLARICGASEYFGEMIAANPLLIVGLNTPTEDVLQRDHRAVLRAAVDQERSFRAELSALRRTWAHLLVEIGARDAEGEITQAESNHLQASLAAASLNVALFIARREMVRRHGPFVAGPRLSVLGLGRMGSGGMDYGSDLDVVLVYDERVASPVEGLTHDEAYARMGEIFVNALSSLTRDGHLYRVDLRLRPDGRNGPVASSSNSFVNYLRTRADVWEWLAYVKLRAAAGDLEFGRAVERKARAAVHQAARATEAEVLRVETRRVRERLARERERARGGIDIKYGRGGMLDVYFAARYLQLKEDVPDDGEDRSTAATLARLRERGALNEEDFRALDNGYKLLRRLDHLLRLLAGRSTQLPSVKDHPVLRDLAHLTGYAAPDALTDELLTQMSAVRNAYERITTHA